MATGIAVAAFAVFVALTAHRGVADDARVRNPHPELAPAPPSPMLGYHHWSRVWELVFVVVALAFAIVLGRSAWRQRRMTQPLIVFLGTTSIAILDPPINWPSFTAYNPDALHFPSTWPWAAFAPTTEPLMVLPGYSVFYFLIGWLGTTVYTRVVEWRLPQDGWARRHPALARFAFAFCLGYVIEVALELLWLRQQLYVYTQTAGPAIRWDWVTLPMTESVAMSICIGFAGALMWRDDSGATLYTLAKARLHLWADDPRRGQLVAASLLCFAMYLGVTGWYSIWRVGGLATTPYTGNWRYPETAIYDPDGVLARAGKPGPFYDDWWDPRPTHDAASTTTTPERADGTPTAAVDTPSGRGGEEPAPGG